MQKIKNVTFKGSVDRKSTAYYEVIAMASIGTNLLCQVDLKCQ